MKKFVEVTRNFLNIKQNNLPIPVCTTAAVTVLTKCHILQTEYDHLGQNHCVSRSQQLH